MVSTDGKYQCSIHRPVGGGDEAVQREARLERDGAYSVETGTSQRISTSTGAPELWRKAALQLSPHAQEVPDLASRKSNNMKSLIKLLALSASLAPVFADVASVSANATDLESSSTCGEESCGMDKRGTEEYSWGGVDWDLDSNKAQVNFYCNSRDVGKVCNANNDKLTDANCALMCNCNQETGKVTCLSWDNCDKKFVS